MTGITGIFKTGISGRTPNDVMSGSFIIRQHHMGNLKPVSQKYDFENQKPVRVIYAGYTYYRRNRDGSL